MNFLNIAAYRFVALDDLPAMRERLRERAQARDLKGTILLAPEGINLFLAGEAAQMEAFFARLAHDPRLAGMQLKRSWSEEQPFNRMLVKIKREIIRMDRPDIRPADMPAPRLAPQDLKAWLDEGRDFLLLDARNEFEVALGTFRGARSAGVKSFTDFPRAAAALPEADKHRPVVTFCTGGIRCEKAAPLLEEMGFNEVYQLEGGILGYFEACGADHFNGECFVFDKRVGLDAALRETGTTQCYACKAVVTVAEQQSPDYVYGKSCPHCRKLALAA